MERQRAGQLTESSTPSRIAPGRGPTGSWDRTQPVEALPQPLAAEARAQNDAARRRAVLGLLDRHRHMLDIARVVGAAAIRPP